MKLGSIVLDCDDADVLADFYQKLLGWKKSEQIHDGEKWVIVSTGNREDTALVFQQIADYQRPVWPTKKSKQQQMIHLDFYVRYNELEKSVAHAMACGAEIMETQLADDWKVMRDPAGHPFCIIPIPGWTE